MLSLWFVWFTFFRSDDESYWSFVVEDMISYIMFSTGWIRGEGFWKEKHDDYSERVWRFGYSRFCVVIQLDK